MQRAEPRQENDSVGRAEGGAVESLRVGGFRRTSKLARGPAEMVGGEKRQAGSIHGTQRGLRLDLEEAGQDLRPDCGALV